MIQPGSTAKNPEVKAILASIRSKAIDKQTEG
jgi:hypothetical protein